MRLTRFTDNALRCLLYLAAEPERAATVHEIAKATRMSPDHLLKVIKRMVELGYVQTIRGRRGGVRLATDPSSIRVADVVRATEDNLALVPCFGANADECPMGPACGLAACMHQALGAFFAVLGHYSISDLSKQRARAQVA
jgi:Rrf2 family transcriptional regulator, nitric oxide-sensitive transcriptional repressor